MTSKRVLVSGYLGFNNFGDEAIFYVLSNHLKNIGFSVSALCSNTKQFEKKYNVKGYKFNNIFEIIKSITNCDILISGGGSLLQNKTSSFSLYYYLIIILLAKIAFKKVIIFAQGIEPIKGKFNKFFTKTVLKKADYITVRDEKSLKLLEENKIKATLLSDPVYSLIGGFEINKNKTGLVVQLRDFKGLDDNFISALAKAVFENYKESNISVFSFQDDYDKIICEKFIYELQKYNINAKLILQKDIPDTINIINSFKYMISARLHGVIVSQAIKTKTFALIYDDKIRTITEELNIDNIDISNYNYDELNNKLSLFFNSPDNSKAHRQFSWNETDDKLKSF